MELLIRSAIALVVYIVAAAVVAGVLRLFFGKSLIVKLFVWLAPGIVAVILAGFISGRAGTTAIWVSAFTAPIGMLVLIANFAVVGKQLISKIKQIADELMESTGEMNSASTLVSRATETLAEGASSQAAAIEESSSSLEEMSAMTKNNADNANQAKQLMAETRAVVSKVNEHMNKMAEAIHKVTTTSEETSKIIRTIDEIAFQTNLLALNAAVEAARAGEAGAGFAVVAGEVRNLAQRAAEAAKNTATLIENTIAVVRESRDLTDLTQKAFEENVEIARKVEDLVKEIASASVEQAQGISQINVAVADLDRVTQQNVSTSEESASAAEEMNAQAAQMKGIVKRLFVMIQGQFEEARELPPPSVERLQRRMITAAPRIARKSPVKLLPAAPKKRLSGRELPQHVGPEKVIPLKKDEFKNF